MGQFLYYYQRPEPATWVFLSSFLIIGVYFMFHRIWSVRNLDLLLILLTPGLMLVYEGRKKQILEADSKVAEVANSLAGQKIPPIYSDSPRLVKHSSSLQDAEADSISADSTTTNTLLSSTQAPVNSNGSLGTEQLPTAKPWTGEQLEYWGFVWLLSVCGVLLARMLADTAMVRRPLLEPNLSIGGLSFIGISLFLFLMANILTCTPDEHRMQGGRLGPGYVLLNTLPDISTVDEDSSNSAQTSSIQERPGFWRVNLARVLGIIANLTIALGIVAIGYFHFDNIKTGVGASTMFLLLPYTAQMTGRLDHMIPGALLVLAILSYRQPVMGGFFLGCASGLVYYPFFLLPLWLSYYWQRGLRRFSIGFIGALVVMTISLMLLGTDGVITHLRAMYGVFPPAVEGLQGIWGLGWHPYFRLPVMVAFILLAFSFVFWPAQKNLATLLCCTASIMIAAQFWHGYGGGLYMAWYLPMFMLTVFRPNLDHSVAMQVVRPITRKSKRAVNPAPSDANKLAQAG
jgi:hypothetical protein